jgi:dephospho-CoA kinase
VFRVGLTGGIASGKTTVADMFAEHGAGIVDTDLIAREVVEPGQAGLEAVVAEFGSGVLLDDGRLDRAALRRIVFNDSEQRKRLDSLLHPLIRARTIVQIEALRAPYAIVVVPLLFESGFDALVDRVVVVDCPEDQQLERLCRRDGMEIGDARRMLAAQIDRQTRLARADDVVDNGGSPAESRRQVSSLHQRYLDLAGRPRLPK